MLLHYIDVIMGTMASLITSLAIVYSIVYSGADQRKHQSSASLAFVRGIHRWPVNSPHKGQVTRKMSPFDDVIMLNEQRSHDIGKVKWAVYSILDIGHSNVQCPISNIQLTSRSYENKHMSWQLSWHRIWNLLRCSVAYATNTYFIHFRGFNLCQGNISRYCFLHHKLVKV